MKKRIAENILAGLAVLMSFSITVPGASAKDVTLNNTDTIRSNNPNLMIDHNRNLNRMEIKKEVLRRRAMEKPVVIRHHNGGTTVIRKRTLEKPVVIHRTPSGNVLLKKNSKPVIIRRSVSRPVVIERDRMRTPLHKQELVRPSVIRSEHTRSL